MLVKMDSLFKCLRQKEARREKALGVVVVSFPLRHCLTMLRNLPVDLLCTVG